MTLSWKGPKGFGTRKETKFQAEWLEQGVKKPRKKKRK